MAKAYWIAMYQSVKDPAALAAYAEVSGPALVAAGAKPLVRGMPAEVIDAGLRQRTVVLEFESVAAAMSAYKSPAYQAALKLLGDGAVRDIRIVEGVS
jgi:uncharacterized protein (DUF1330 family)